MLTITANQLKSNSELTIDYDDNGSTIKKIKAGVITTFDYNTENRLSTVKDNAGATVAIYTLKFHHLLAAGY